MGELSAQWAKLLEKQDRQEQTDLIEDTFGPNPCTSLVLTHEDGTSFGSPCDGKRCTDCGPRKKATIQHQMRQGFGDYAYITTYDDRNDLDRAIGRTRKAAQRAGHQLLLQSVGDSTLGWIVVSNRQLRDGQRLTTVADWARRILDRYHHAVQRIRRSYALGRVSLVRLIRKAKSGQPSMWRVRTFNSEAMRAVEGLDWDEMLAETEWREGVLLKYEPADQSLPVPF